jgi:hypothetical protein
MRWLSAQEGKNISLFNLILKFEEKTSRAWRQDDGGQTRSLQHLLRPNLDHVGSRGRFPEYGMSRLEFFSRPKKSCRSNFKSNQPCR